MTQAIEMLKKLSPKTICEDLLGPIEEKVDLYTVYGTANDITSGESTYGPWDALVGSFEACRIDNGQIFAGIKAFIPEPLGSMLVNKVKELEAGEKVEFAVMISIKPADTKTGYEYICTPIVQTEATSEMAKLRQTVQTNLAALPAPNAGTPKPKAKAKAKAKVKSEADNKK